MLNYLALHLSPYTFSVHYHNSQLVVKNFGLSKGTSIYFIK